MHLNCLWIELKFIFLPLNLFLSLDFCVGWGTELVLPWQIPLRHFWILEILLVYTQKSVSSRTMYIWKAGWRNRLSLKLCNIRMKMYLNPFMWLLMKVGGHMVSLVFHFYHFFSEDFRYSCLTQSFKELDLHGSVWRPLTDFWLFYFSSLFLSL